MQSIIFKDAPNWDINKNNPKAWMLLTHGSSLLFLLPIGFWLRRSNPENKPYAHVVIQISAIGTAGLFYPFFDTMSGLGIWFVGLALGVFYLFFFKPVFALTGLGSFALVTIALTLEPVYLRVIFFPLIFLFALGWLPLLIALLLFREPRESKNPQDWSRVDQSLLFIMIFYIYTLLLFFGHVYRDSMLQIGPLPYFDEKVWIGMLLPFLCVLLVLLPIGILIRRRFPESRIYAHLVIQFMVIVAAYICYISGSVTQPTNILFGLSVVTFSLLLFRPSISYPGIATFLVLLIGSTIAVELDLIPYAPLFSSPPYVDGKIHSWYLLETMISMSIILILMLFLIAFIVARWRNREAKLGEMTNLSNNSLANYYTSTKNTQKTL